MPDAAPSPVPSGAPAVLTELKVSAHLMMLHEGVFCVYNAPGTAAVPSASGLPGVRISPAPVMPEGAGTVAISGFKEDGWLGGEEVAALIRVSGGPAPVLVTVYQDMDTDHPAPKLQVIRLSGDAAATVAEPEPDPEQPAPIEVAAHIYGLGDVGGQLGQWMGERGSKRWIEGFGLAPSMGIASADVEYQAVLGRGWLSPWSEAGQFCGSRGMSLPILGLRVRLRGEAADRFSVSVEGSFVDGSAVGPVGSGEACEAPSMAALEAFCVTFHERAERAAAAKPARKAPAPKGAAAAAPTRPDATKPAAPAKPATPAPAKAGPPGKPGKDSPAPKPAKRTPATTRRR